MIFILNREGTVIETVTSPVYQGSNANEVVVLAPFAPTNTVTVGFTLPNGLIVQPKLTDSGKGTAMTSLPVKDFSLKVGETYEDMSAWYCKLDRDITRYSGTLTMQFFLYDAAGDILASSSTTVPVQKGVPVLDGTTFDASTAAQLQTALNAVLVKITSIATDTEKNTTDITSLETRVSANEQNIDGLQSTTAELSQAVDGLDGDSKQLKSEIDALDARMFAAEDSIIAVEDRVAENEKSITSLGTRMTNAEGNIKDLKSSVSLIWTILGNTIINITTVEDAYNTRVTAGGLPAVDEAPTTVHTISGATTTSRNIVDLAGAISSSTVHGVSVTANNNLVTFSGTADQTSWFSYSSFIDLDRYIGKTLTFSQSPFFTSSSAEGAAFWLLSVDGQARSTNANANGTLTVTLEPGHSYRASIRSGSGGTINQTISFMLNEGATALPYSDYYAGVKSAVLAGIVSTGRNLLAVTKSSTATNGGLTYQADVSTGTVTITGTAGADGSASSLFDEFYLPRGVYTLYMPNKAAGYGIGWNIKTTKHHAIAAVSWNASKPYGAFTVEEAGKFYLLAYASSAAVDVHYTETPMILPGTVTENFPAFETYHADTSFALATPVTLGKWDHIDVDAQKMIVGTATLTQETPFTDEQLAQYADYVLSADGKTIAYESATTTRTAVTLPKSYKAWRGGCEYITADASGGQNPDNVKITVNQDYYEEVSNA